MKQDTLILWSSVIRFSKGKTRVLLIPLLMLIYSVVNAQCPSGYTQAQLNWDKMEFFHNTGSSGMYENYITSTMERVQKFAIGKTWLAIETSHDAVIDPGALNYADVGTHTGDVAGFTGDDIYLNPNANGQSLTITFNEQVYNVSFTLYDIDRSARVDVDAYNEANTALNVGVTTYTNTILTVNGNNATNTYVTANTTTLDDASNRGTATFSIAGPVKRVVITFTTIGSDRKLYLSDINACTPGTFPVNYHQNPKARPFNGPVANQPSYILATPDNNSVYMVNPLTGHAKFLFRDVSKEYVNSFAYDQENFVLYYISEKPSPEVDYKAIKKYDFKTNTISEVVSNVTTQLGIPTFNFGVGSAGAAWYDGALYFGIEGGKYDVGSGTNATNDRPREAVVWRIDFDAAGNAVNAYQVFATNTYNHASNTSTHDWGDFLIKDGILIDFSTARNGSNYSESRYEHFNLQTGQSVIYQNPGTSPFSGQAGLTWHGDMYWFRLMGTAANQQYGVVGKYNGDGTNDISTLRPLKRVPGPYGVGPDTGWVGNIGDASEGFRPPMDFGDAPASYDPDPFAPAVHETDTSLRLGSTIALEMEGTSSELADAEGAEEDAIGAPPAITVNGTITYTIPNISVFNNSGEPATLVAWLDYNFNGVFDPEEGRLVTVPSSASQQFVSITWEDIPVPFTSSTQTFVRFRLTRQSNGMTEANGMNGWFPDGEVEDFAVLVGTVLPKDIMSFTANKQSGTSVNVRWNILQELPVASFEVQRSYDQTHWTNIAVVQAREGVEMQQYNVVDNDPNSGTVWYRVRVNYKSGDHKYTDARSVQFGTLEARLRIAPNPASGYADVQLTALERGLAVVEVFDQSGRKLLTQNKQVEQGFNKIRLQDLNALTNGIYFVRVRLNETVHNTKLIINRN